MSRLLPPLSPPPSLVPDPLPKTPQSISPLSRSEILPRSFASRPGKLLLDSRAPDTILLGPPSHMCVGLVSQVASCALRVRVLFAAFWMLGNDFNVVSILSVFKLKVLIVMSIRTRSLHCLAAGCQCWLHHCYFAQFFPSTLMRLAFVLRVASSP